MAHTKFLYAISVQLLDSYDFTFFQILFLNDRTNSKYLESTSYFLEKKFFVRFQLFFKSKQWKFPKISVSKFFI